MDVVRAGAYRPFSEKATISWTGDRLASIGGPGLGCTQPHARAYETRALRCTSFVLAGTSPARRSFAGVRALPRFPETAPDAKSSSSIKEVWILHRSLISRSGSGPNESEPSRPPASGACAEPRHPVALNARQSLCTNHAIREAAASPASSSSPTGGLALLVDILAREVIDTLAARSGKLKSRHTSR